MNKHNLQSMFSQSQHEKQIKWIMLINYSQTIINTLDHLPKIIQTTFSTTATSQQTYILHYHCNFLVGVDSIALEWIGGLNKG